VRAPVGVARVGYISPGGKGFHPDPVKGAGAGADNSVPDRGGLGTAGYLGGFLACVLVQMIGLDQDVGR